MEGRKGGGGRWHDWADRIVDCLGAHWREAKLSYPEFGTTWSVAARTAAKGWAGEQWKLESAQGKRKLGWRVGETGWGGRSAGVNRVGFEQELALNPHPIALPEYRARGKEGECDWAGSWLRRASYSQNSRIRV